MQRIRFTVFLTLLSALSAPAFGKTTQLDNGDFLTVIDATAGGAFTTEPHDFTYFSFEHQDVVALTDAEAAESAEWHIAFKRSNILLNGGISGPGNVTGFDLTGAEDIVAEEAFDAITATDVPTADAFIADGPAYAIGAWYSYDSASPPPRGHRPCLRVAHCQRPVRQVRRRWNGRSQPCGRRPHYLPLGRRRRY